MLQASQMSNEEDAFPKSHSSQASSSNQEQSSSQKSSQKKKMLWADYPPDSQDPYAYDLNDD